MGEKDFATLWRAFLVVCGYYHDRFAGFAAVFKEEFEILYARQFGGFSAVLEKKFKEVDFSFAVRARISRP